MPSESKSHLLVNVFLTPIGLNSYKLGKIKKYENFKIDRFLTTCKSLGKVQFKSVRIYCLLHHDFLKYQSTIISELYTIFPSAEIYFYRNEKISQWREISLNYDDNDLILFTTNDDHAFVAPNTAIYEELVSELCINDKYNMALVTHFPEMIGRLGILKQEDVFSQNIYRTTMHYVIGTVLVKGKFFKSWWADKEWDKTPNLTIARTDNPYGRSVSIGKTHALLSKYEILRHLDGYSHVYAFRPLRPLRNTYYNLRPSGNWHYAFWPKRISSKENKFSDLHQTHFGEQYRIFSNFSAGVALLQAHWGIRFYPENFKFIITSNEIKSKILRIVVLIISIISPNIFRNIPDYLIEKCYRFINKFFSRIGKYIPEWPSELVYYGTIRFILISFRQEKNLFVFFKKITYVLKKMTLFVIANKNKSVGH